MNVLWGYLSSYTYLFLVIIACGFLQKRHILSGELSRKIIHILICFTWCLMDYFWGRSYHQIIISASFVIINFLSYKYHFLAGVERASKSHAGTVYYALAMLALSVASYLYAPLYYPFGAAVFVLSFGDGVAPLAGGIRKGNLSLTREKTLYGFLACFVFSFAALALFCLAFGLNAPWFVILAIAALGAVVELLSVRGLDNFFLSFTVALALLCETSGLVTTAFWTCALLSVFITISALAFRALTHPAAFTAQAMMRAAAFAMPYTAFCLYVIPFVVIAIVGACKKTSAHTARGTRQVLINGLPALLGFALYYFTQTEAFFVFGGAALGACFADSCASDVGTLSRKTPYDFLRRRTVEKGQSGGITLLGSCACIVGAGIVAATSMIARPLSFAPLFLFVAAVLGCTLDTVFGSLFQALYRVQIAQEPPEDITLSIVPVYRYTETPQPMAELIKGKAFVTNNAVNLWSSTLAAALAALCYALLF